MNHNFILGSLFRSQSYSITPGDKDIGVVPINDKDYDCDEEVAERIRTDYSLRKDCTKKIILLREKDEVKICEHTLEGLKILTVKRRDVKVRYGC